MFTVAKIDAQLKPKLFIHFLKYLDFNFLLIWKQMVIHKKVSNFQVFRVSFTTAQLKFRLSTDSSFLHAPLYKLIKNNSP